MQNQSKLIHPGSIQNQFFLDHPESVSTSRAQILAAKDAEGKKPSEEKKPDSEPPADESADRCPQCDQRMDPSQRHSGQCCPLRLCSWLSPNPIIKKRGAYPTLQRKAARMDCCVPCFNNVNCNIPDKNVATCKEELTDGRMSQDSYNEKLQRWEDGMNGAAPRCKRPSDCMGHATTRVVKSRNVKLAKNCGIFWPVKQWNEAVGDKRSPAFGQPLCQEEEIMVLQVDGPDKKMTGVVRDKKWGEPIGTWSITEEVERRMEYLKDIA